MNETEVKRTALAILASANKTYCVLRDGKGNPAYLTGKATAYISTFRVLAKVCGLNPDHYGEILVDLEDAMRPFMEKYKSIEQPKPTHVLTKDKVVTVGEVLSKERAFVEESAAKTPMCLRCRGIGVHAPYCPNDIKPEVGKKIDIKT